MKNLLLLILMFLSLIVFSENSNAQWVQTKRPSVDSSTFQIFSLVAVDSNLYMGANNNLYISPDNGESWNKTGYNGVNPVKAIAVKGKYIFVGTGSNGVYLSPDSGASWSSSNSGLNNLNVTELVTSGDNVVGKNDAGVILSKDNGLSWNTTVVTSEYPFSYGMLTAGKKNLYVKGSSHGNRGNIVSKSDDNGATWNIIFSVEINAMNSVTAIGELNGYVFLGIVNLVNGLPLSTIWRSNEYGSNWSTVKNDFPNDEMVQTFASLNTTIFAGTSMAVYVSKDYGMTWSDISQELKGKSIVTLVLNNKYIFARTDSNTIWKREISEFLTDVEKSRGNVPENYSLLQNYPNPFNPVTTIGYSIPKASYVELNVYDMLGREVTNLVRKDQSAGEYKVQFDGSSLPSGIYIYTIQAGQFRDSKKLVFLK